MVTQQLQADELAAEMAAQLLSGAPHHEAKLYYSTMAQDEARHAEAWLQLIEEGRRLGRALPIPRPARAHLPRADSLEDKVLLMQVFFERLTIPRFRLIARSLRRIRCSPTLLLFLTIDDGIHHSSGMAYERRCSRMPTRR